MFVLQGENPVCLLCYESVSLIAAVTSRRSIQTLPSSLVLSQPVSPVHPNTLRWNKQKATFQDLYFLLSLSCPCLGSPICANICFQWWIWTSPITGQVSQRTKTRHWHTDQGETVSGIRAGNEQLSILKHKMKKWRVSMEG